MIILENITVYECEYCGRKYFSRHFCKRHENLCPKRKGNIPACYGCVFLTKEEVCRETPTGYSRLRSFYCGKKDIFLMPIVSAKRGSEIFGVLEEIHTMPVKCKERIQESEEF